MSGPPVGGRATTSTPLMDVQVYRPGPFLALGMLLLPVVAALVGAATTLNVAGAIPVWLPLVLLLWLPCVPASWFAMQSVRTSSVGLAAGRPWSTWHEVPWMLIDRVEQRGPIVRVSGTNGVRLAIIPALLRDGSRLKRQLLLRLPPHVFVGGISQEAQQLLSGGIHAMPDGGLSGILHARPKARWRVLAIIASLIPLGLSALAIVLLPLAISVPLAVLGTAVSLAGLLVFSWFAQELLINETGVSIVFPVVRRTRAIQWAEVELVEHSPNEMMLRMRGHRRLLCAGPTLLPPTERDLMRAFIHEYCTSRGVPIVRRTWLL